MQLTSSQIAQQLHLAKPQFLHKRVVVLGQAQALLLGQLQIELTLLLGYYHESDSLAVAGEGGTKEAALEKLVGVALVKLGQLVQVRLGYTVNETLVYFQAFGGLKKSTLHFQTSGCLGTGHFLLIENKRELCSLNRWL